MLRITLRFPLGVYHAQSMTDFATAEWPPHPVRLIAALKAAAHGRDADGGGPALRVIDALAAAEPPLIVAPRTGNLSEADGAERVALLRGASRWTPRNHELSELKGIRGGISPRDLGRTRAEVQKVGVAIGDCPVAFEWSDLTLDGEQLLVLEQLASDMTVLGTSRSPAIVSIDAAVPMSDRLDAWAPAIDGTAAQSAVQVRVPTARTPAELDAWHARRSTPLSRGGTVNRAAYIPPVALGKEMRYVHGVDAAAEPRPPHDPEWWGDMIIIAVDQRRGEDRPKAAAAFAFARALRKAVLDCYGPEGSHDEAPPVLRGRDAQPHAAFVPLSFVAEVPRDRSTPPAAGARRFDPSPQRVRPAGASFADGRTLGVAIVLPHPSRSPDVVYQRLAVEAGLARLLGLPDGSSKPVHVPGVGPVRLGLLDSRPLPSTLRESRYRSASRRWSTATPLVHSRHLPRKSEQAVYEQVARECADVGLPAPARVDVRRAPRFRGAARSIDPRRLPTSWTGPLRGPQVHLDLWFDEPVLGPVLLGRARHFGLGLCLPFADDGRR